MYRYRLVYQCSECDKATDTVFDEIKDIAPLIKVSCKYCGSTTEIMNIQGKREIRVIEVCK